MAYCVSIDWRLIEFILVLVLFLEVTFLFAILVNFLILWLELLILEVYELV